MKLSLYTVDEKYCYYLRIRDSRVPFNKASIHKENRPFVGIVLSINGFDYFAPLSSPKMKHLKMKDSIDIMKIDGGDLGVINFNNMLPVPSFCISKVEIAINEGDTPDTIRYKNLLAKQISWCNTNEEIIKKAQILYNTITKGRASKKLIERCCDYTVLEQACSDYLASNN